MMVFGKRCKLWSLSLSCICFGVSSWVYAASQTQMVVGIPEFGKSLNYLKEDGPAARFVRAAVVKSITERSFGGVVPYRLSLADRLSVSADQKRWSFRMNREFYFSNGARITASDVVYSLGACKSSGALPYLENVTAREGQFDVDGAEQWVDVELAIGEHNFPLDLTECPVIDKRSAELFGERLGEGTNLVGSGDFQVSGIKPQSEIVLRRVTKASRPGGLEEARIRGFRESSQALAALRIGTVDLFLTKDADVLTKAQKDETLVVGSCLGYSMVKRKGLQVDCEKSLSPLSFKYDS